MSHELETLRVLAERGHTSIGLVDSTIFERLAQLDLVEHVSIIPGAIRLTQRGRDALDEIERNGWLLGPAEARDRVAAMTGTFEARITALLPFIGEPARFEKVVQLVMTENRSAVAFSLARHPDPDVRADLFYAWGGPGEGVDEYARFLPPGPPFDWATDPMFVDLLHLGLNDDAEHVRDATARLAYVTQSGHHVTDELLADLARERPSLWSAAALGTARDDRSLAVLRTLVASDDLELAGSAVRGLAARPDGRAEFLAALQDPRPHIRWVGEVSLGMIATGLTEDELTTLRGDTRFHTALAHYRARHPEQIP